MKGAYQKSLTTKAKNAGDYRGIQQQRYWFVQDKAVVLPVAAAAHANPLGELGSEFLLLFQSTPIFL